MTYSNEMTITMTKNSAALKALEIAQKEINSNANTFNDGYANDPSSKFLSALEVDENIITIENDEGFFTTEDFPSVVKSILEAIAKNLTTETFTCSAYTSSSYSEGEIEASYANGTLEIAETYYPEGYVEYLTCPECGEEIVSLEDYDPNETYTCPECGEEIDLSEQYEECAPVHHETTINIIQGGNNNGYSYQNKSHHF